MSAPSAHGPACVVRAHATPEGIVRLHARNQAWSAEGQTSYAPVALHPSALDYLLAALASDVILGLAREAVRAGAAIDALELNLAGHLENPLVPLGVVGENGSPRLERVTGSLYVRTDLDDHTLRGLWERALEKAPVFATLASGVTVDITLKPVP
jgi:hypothetical protein